MNITIFGGSGFIGQKLAEELIIRGHNVTSISRRGKPADLSSSWSEKVHWFQSDILNDTQWHKASKRQTGSSIPLGFFLSILKKTLLMTASF